MIRVSVCYPATPGGTFDWDYYLDTHQRIVRETMFVPGFVAMQIDRGMPGIGGGPAPYVAIAHMVFDSPEAFQAAQQSAGPALADIPNFTNVQPVLQVSEIVA